MPSITGNDGMWKHTQPAFYRSAQSSWWYENATGHEPELFCYTSEQSIVVGDALELRVHTTASRYDVLVYRDGVRADIVHVAESLRGVSQPLQEHPYRDGCDWDVGCSIDTSGWQPGGYVILLTAQAAGTALRHFHWVSLRPERLGKHALTLIAATCTWNAYNNWGGSSSYGGIDGPNTDEYSRILSFDRPRAAGQVWLPPGAPREPNPPDLEDSSHVFYPTKDWAFSHGYAKHYASAGWATFERHFVRWAESQGYDIVILTQHDLHFRPELLRDSGPLVLVGHDEYWTWEMRQAIDTHVQEGGHVARLAGNFLWQVRLSSDGSQQVCYRQHARAEDPVRQDPEQRHLLTYGWDLSTIEYSAARTFGVSGTWGIYADFGGMARRTPGGFTIYRPDHWTLADTRLGYGDVLGARSRVATYELDGLDYVIADGLPFATSENGVDPETIEIVGLCVTANRERDFGVAGSHLDVGDEDYRHLAEIRYGEVTAETLARASRGCGVIAEYHHGHGVVVSMASAEWVNGLRLRDPHVEQVTRNVLDRFLARSLKPARQRPERPVEG